MQPLKIFLGFRAIWIAPHCFDFAFNTILFNVFFELPSIIILEAFLSLKTRVHAVKFLFYYAAPFLMEQAYKIQEKHLVTAKYNSSFYHFGQSA